MAYLLDADVFIRAKNLHYGFDFCPGFWDWLVDSNERGSVFSIEEATQWFDDLWDEAEPYDLAGIFEVVFQARSPWNIFIRVLWQLYGEEVQDESNVDDNLPLTSFQKHGVARALRLIRETGGVIVADEEGNVWPPVPTRSSRRAPVGTLGRCYSGVRRLKTAAPVRRQGCRRSQATTGNRTGRNRGSRPAGRSEDAPPGPPTHSGLGSPPSGRPGPAHPRISRRCPSG